MFGGIGAGMVVIDRGTSRAWPAVRATGLRWWFVKRGIMFAIEHYCGRGFMYFAL